MINPSHEIIANAAITQANILPDKVDHPGLVAASAVVGGALATAAWISHKRSDEKMAVEFPNPVAMEQAIRDVRGDDIEGNSSRLRRLRIAPALAMVAGTAVTAMGALGGFKQESTSSKESAQTVMVQDASYSMQYSRDLGTSRLSATIDALNTSGYRGNLSVIEAATDSTTRIPMERSWRDDLTELRKPEVDPNGGNIADAIDDAMSDLPIEKNDKGDRVRRGTVLVVSDGTISNTQKQMAKVAERAKENGVNLRVVVPGTPDATYQIPGSQPVKSGVNPDVFASFGSKNIAVADSQEAVGTAVHNALMSAGSRREVKDWNTLRNVGIALMVLAGLAMSMQVVRKVV